MPCRWTSNENWFPLPPAVQYLHEALHAADHHRTRCEGFYVSSPPFQGYYSEEDTLSNIKDAIRLHLEDRQTNHDELAEPKSFSLSTVEVSA
jgi:predicted RNase H-like HicB family nuclease